jgi:hypothetical protein
VNLEGMQINDCAALGWIDIGKELSEVEATFGEQGLFEGDDGAQPPKGIDDGLDKIALVIADGLQLLFV